MDFFITAMPRSKTAWMALYLCQGNFSCYHERLAQVGLKSMLEHKKQHPYSIGDSDSGLLIHWREFAEKFPNSPWVFIERDLEECSKSCIEYGIPQQNILFAAREAEKLKSEIENLFTIPFDFNEGQLSDLCSFLGVPFNEEHTKRMMKFNIQMSDAEKQRLIQHNS